MFDFGLGSSPRHKGLNATNIEDYLLANAVVVVFIKNSCFEKDKKDIEIMWL